MIILHIHGIDGERCYMIQTPEPKEVIEFNQKYGHEGCDYQMEVDGKDLEMNEIEKWFGEHGDN